MRHFICQIMNIFPHYSMITAVYQALVHVYGGLLLFLFARHILVTKARYNFYHFHQSM